VNFENVTLALRARYLLVLAITLLTFLAALAVTLTSPKIYTATSAVVLDVKYADPIAGSILPAWTQPSFMATQLDIITSERVAAKVVKVMKMDQQPGIADAWRAQTGGKGNLIAWLGDGLRGRLDAKPSKDSNVISIVFKDRDPKVAADVANAFAQAFIDASVDLRREPALEYSKYFVAQAQLQRDRLEKAQSALSEYQQQNHIILASDERFDIENNRLNSLANQLVDAENQWTDSQTHEAQVRSNTGTISEVLQSPLIQSLKNELGTKQAALRQLGGNLGVNNPRYRQAQAEVAALRSQLASETSQIANGVATTNRINQQRVADIGAALEAQKARVLKFKQDRDAAAVLQRDVDSAKSAYDAVSQRVNQSNLESQANQTNIAILNPAYEPSRPSSPKVELNLTMALLVGLLLGIGAALLLEQVDRRVRSIDDLGRVLGLPVMGVIGRVQGRLGGGHSVRSSSTPAASPPPTPSASCNISANTTCTSARRPCGSASRDRPMSSTRCPGSSTIRISLAAKARSTRR
jgi:chain length determinant protein EpsF